MGFLNGVRRKGLKAYPESPRRIPGALPSSKSEKRLLFSNTLAS